jgi:BlaI family transcriptional regulator, penicillinase repressor
VKFTPPSDLELQVLSVLWKKGPCTARQVLDAMPDKKKRAYTTVLTVMQVMEKKGLLSHTRDGMANVYKPSLSRAQILRPILRGWVTKIFGGSPSAAIQQLLSDTEVDDAELAKIQALVKDFQLTSQNGKGKQS